MTRASPSGQAVGREGQHLVVPLVGNWPNSPPLESTTHAITRSHLRHFLIFTFLYYPYHRVRCSLGAFFSLSWRSLP